MRIVTFQDYYQKLSLRGIKNYMRSLFRGLRDIHSRGIIHRDIKPANFLFDTITGVGTICDLGLACVSKIQLHHSIFNLIEVSLANGL